MVFVYILLFILILFVVVCFHEFGHYFFAKKAGILVNEFAFGMGPKLLSKKYGETVWSLRAFPLGGFCAMSGEEATNPIVNIEDKVRIALNSNNKVYMIIKDIDDPNYKDLELITIEKIDLFGAKMSPLFINDYEVERNCIIKVEKDEVQIAPEERNYFAKSVWQRFLVCFGGPLNNIILAFIVFLILGFLVGVVDSGSNIIGEVSSNSPAEIYGLKKGDKIIKIGDFEVNNWTDIGNAISATNSREISIKVLRDGESETYNVYAQYFFQNLGFSSSLDGDKEVVSIICESEAALGGTNKTKAFQEGGLRNGDIIVGMSYGGRDYPEEGVDLTWDYLYNFALNTVDGGNIKFYYLRDGVRGESNTYSVYSDSLLESQGYLAAYKQIGIQGTISRAFFPCVLSGLNRFKDSALVIFRTLGLLLTSKEVGVKDMGGFITILNQTANYASSGFANLLYWVGLLSINLGIVNLLPIPALDGGRIVFLLFEGITGKKINPKVETIIINVVFWLLMALIGYILIQDVLRLIIQLR